MASIALFDKSRERTVERIDIIAEYIEDNGSIYDDNVLTAMYIYLTDMVTDNSSINNVEITDLYIFTEEERDMKAGTDIFIEPEVVGFDRENMTLSVVVGNEEMDYEAANASEGIFCWNTKTRAAGNYNVYGIVTDNQSGEVLAIKNKMIEVQESFDISDVKVNYTPKMYQINSEKKISISIETDIISNISKNVTADITVKDDNGNIVYHEDKTINGGQETSYLIFDGFGFVPQCDTTGTLYLQVEIMANGTPTKTINKNILVYSESDSRKINLDYTIDREYVLPEDDRVNVKFQMEGIGEEKVQRKPVDIFMCIDNSGSMSDEDLAQAKKSAEKIVEYMQPDDRCIIQYILSGITNCKLTSDKEVLINAIHTEPYNYLWGTWVHVSLNLAINKLSDTPPERQKIYLLLSDGEPSFLKQTIQIAQKAADNDIKIYTLGLRKTGEDFLKQISEIGSGRYVYCPTNEELVDFMIDIAGDIFSMAGRDVKLSMTLEKDVPYQNITIEPKPDTIQENEDGTTQLVWEKDYICPAETFDYDIGFKTSAENEGDVIKLVKDIELTYTDVSDEQVVVKLDPISVRTIKKYVSSTIVTDKDSYTNDEDVTINLDATKGEGNKTVTGKVQIVDENDELVSVVEKDIIIEDELHEIYTWNTKDIMPGNYKVVVNWERNGQEVNRQEYPFIIKEMNSETETETGTQATTEQEKFTKIKGKIEVSENEILAGEEATVNYTTQNLGDKIIDSADIIVNLVSVQSEKSEIIDHDNYSINVSESIHGNAQINGDNLEDGEYLVMLIAKCAEEEIVLDVTGFQVKQQEVVTDVETTSGNEESEKDSMAEPITEDISMNTVEEPISQKTIEEETTEISTEKAIENETDSLEKKVNKKISDSNKNAQGKTGMAETVKTGDFGERIAIARNITLVLLVVFILIILAGEKKRGKDD